MKYLSLGKKLFWFQSALWYFTVFFYFHDFSLHKGKKNFFPFLLKRTQSRKCEAIFFGFPVLKDWRENKFCIENEMSEFRVKLLVRNGEFFRALFSLKLCNIVKILLLKMSKHFWPSYSLASDLNSSSAFLLLIDSCWRSWVHYCITPQVLLIKCQKFTCVCYN